MLKGLVLKMLALTILLMIMLLLQISEFLQTFSVAVSVLTLTALSGDRLIAIVFPLYVYK